MLYRFLMLVALSAVRSFASGCSSVGSAADQLNPYAEGNSVQLGEENNSALLSSGGNRTASAARQALEVLGTKRMQASPQPYYPVVRPREVRLMWIPDRLNRHGDLVPSHYYYLRVLDDQWELNDAFEYEDNLKANQGNGYSRGSAPRGRSRSYGAGSGGSTPWVYKEE